MHADLHAPSAESLTAAAIGRLAPGTLVDGRFVIRGMLGQGGMGLALRAWEPEWERDCVLKMLAPHMHARFKPALDCAELLGKEAKTLAKLANIHSTAFVQVYGRGVVQLDVGDGEGPLELPYYVMELLRGSTFQRLIVNRRGPKDRERDAKEREFFAWKHVINAAHKLSAALSVAHSLGIIHRDLKPDNVFLHSLGHGHEVKIIDWGISTREGESRREGTGTVRYASPELLSEGARFESTQSDIYPLGLFIYELATLRGPFDGLGREALAYAHVYEDAKPLSEFRSDAPAALVQLVAAMLQKAPEKRPTAKAAAAVLSELLFETLDDAGDSQIGDLLRGSRDARGAHAAASYPLPRSASAPPRELLVSEPVVERAHPEPLRAVVTLPLSPQRLPVKYPDTVPDAEPFGSTVNAAVTAPLGPPAPVDGHVRVFQSTAEIFEAVWDGDTRYASSPLEPRAPETEIAHATEPTRAPRSGTTSEPVVERTSSPPRAPSMGARRLAVGILTLAVGLTAVGIAVRLKRVVETNPAIEEPTRVTPAVISSGTALSAAETAQPSYETTNDALDAALDTGGDGSYTAVSVTLPTRERSNHAGPPKGMGSSTRTPGSPPRSDGIIRDFDLARDEPQDASRLDDLNVEISH